MNADLQNWIPRLVRGPSGRAVLQSKIIKIQTVISLELPHLRKKIKIKHAKYQKRTNEQKEDYGKTFQSTYLSSIEDQF